MIATGLFREKPARPQPSRPSFPRYKKVERARRALFGYVDHELNREWIEKQLHDKLITDSVKWNFDFSEGRVAKIRGLLAPKKMRRDANTSSEDLEAQYYEPDTAGRASSHIETTSIKIHKQTLITDYMRVMKRSVAIVEKEPADRPIKLRKLNESTI